MCLPMRLIPTRLKYSFGVKTNIGLGAEGVLKSTYSGVTFVMNFEC